MQFLALIDSYLKVLAKSEPEPTEPLYMHFVETVLRNNKLDRKLNSYS